MSCNHSLISLIIGCVTGAQAAPVVAALSKGPAASREDAVSGLYGGAGGERAVTDEVYSAIGSVRAPTHQSFHPPALPHLT